MELGILYPSTEVEPSAGSVREFSEGVQTLGYDYIAVGDHVLGASRDREVQLWGPYDDTDPFHDPFVLIGYMAAVVDRLSFSTGVLILPQRQTVLVARQAADVAILSGNRLRLGVGVGWSTVEFDALGQPFGRRGRRTDEQLPLLRRLWREPLVTYDGADERIDRAALVPRPSKDIPLWIGGNGAAAFRRAAQHGDGFMFAGSIDNALRGLDALKQSLAEYGRADDPFGLEFIMIPPAPGRGSAKWPKKRPEFLDETTEAVARWREAGGTHATVFTTWMGFESMDAHLSYAARVRDRVVGGQPGSERSVPR